MRTCLSVALAGLALSLAPLTATAQYPGFTTYNTWVAPSPYYVPGPVGYRSTYTSPYGYRSTYATGVYPTPWGSNTYQSYRVQARPIYAGPYHSIYYDPTTLSYRYGTGTRNSPNYSYRFYYGY